VGAHVDVEHFREHGWVRMAGPVPVADLVAWVEDVAAWPEGEGPWLHHHELIDDGPRLCRSEGFVGVHEGLTALLTEGSLLEAASALLGEPAVLYKEKVNYKLPGGAGFAPHQDAHAWPFVGSHVSCMVAVDDARPANGCLEVASGLHHDLLPADAAGCLPADVAAGLAWAPVELAAGEVLWFHSRTPHRSGANPGPHPRRALYPTYNAAAEGDLRAAYYEEKRRVLGSAREGEPVAMSLSGDFQGRLLR
jgi:hypothetical protein